MNRHNAGCRSIVFQKMRRFEPLFVRPSVRPFVGFQLSIHPFARHTATTRRDASRQSTISSKRIYSFRFSCLRVLFCVARGDVRQSSYTMMRSTCATLRICRGAATGPVTTTTMRRGGATTKRRRCDRGAMEWIFCLRTRGAVDGGAGSTTRTTTLGG